MFERPYRVRIVLLVGALLLLPAAVATAQDAAPIGGEPTTGESTNRDERAPEIVVSDVRVGSHAGFDRVVFEIEGEGQSGWFIGYVDEPKSDGSGEPVEVAGDAALSVSITNHALPGEEPEGTEPWSGDVAGPPGGVITEVVDDITFEGNNTLFVGLDRERPYRVARLSDPQRVVVDIVTDAPAEDDAADDDAADDDADAAAADDVDEAAAGVAERDTPVGGVATGLGGGSAGVSLPALITVLALLCFATAGALGARRGCLR